MRDFSFITPTKVEFGKQANLKIAGQLKEDGRKRVLLVAGGNSRNPKMAELYRQIETNLKEAGIEYFEFFGIAPNPTIVQAREGVACAKKEQADAVLAIGGGSVIDTAKCIAAGAVTDVDVWDFYMGKERIKKALPVYVSLTLSGTGSENNGNSVISDKEKGIKKLLVSPHFYPKCAFVDPQVQETVPKHVFASCCADSMVHIWEHYFDGGEELEASDAIAEALLRTFVTEAPKVIENPQNYEARAAVMWAASLALNGVPSLVGLGGKGGDWSSHNLETGVSIAKNSMHGMGLAILFPAWLEYVSEKCQGKLVRMSREVFGIEADTDEQTAEQGIAAIRSFFRSMGCPKTLEELGVSKDELDTLTDIISVFVPMGRLYRLQKEDVSNILKIACGSVQE